MNKNKEIRTKIKVHLTLFSSTKIEKEGIANTTHNSMNKRIFQRAQYVVS